jgi:hypothetical protein
MPINLDAIVAQTFDIIDATVPDTVVPVIYMQAAVAIYDAQTRSYANGICSTETVAVIARPKSEEYDGENVAHSTAKFLVAADKLPDITPRVLDNIQTQNGQLFSITKVGSVPGESLHIIFAEATTV